MDIDKVNEYLYEERPEASLKWNLSARPTT